MDGIALPSRQIFAAPDWVRRDNVTTVSQLGAVNSWREGKAIPSLSHKSSWKSNNEKRFKSSVH